MKKQVINQENIGILFAIIFGSIFVIISLFLLKYLSGVTWYIVSSILRLIFGIAIIIASKKFFKREIKDLFTLKESKKAILAGIGFIIYFIYYIMLIIIGFKDISGLTFGLVISKILFQQIATGFYEELNYRLLILDGYFFGKHNFKNKLIYAFISFILFGLLHTVTGWDTDRFLLTGIIGFSFAVIYIKSRNIVVPMLLHFIYDIFANLAEFIEWNNSVLFQNMSSLFEITIAVMFIISFIILVRKKNDKNNQYI